MPLPTVSLTNRLDKEISNILKRMNTSMKVRYSNKQISYADFLANKMLLIFVIKEGVPYSLFNLIQNFSPFTEANWSSFLDISTKSLQRYRQTARTFKSIHSEKIIEMFEVTDVGLQVFGELDKFKLWLETPNFSLGNLTPLELLKDSYGKELVIGELTRINYGILV